MTNVGTEPAFRHDEWKHFQKSKRLLRSEVSRCAPTLVDLQLHRSTCLASRISTQKKPFPRLKFMPALNLDIVDAGRSPIADFPRSSRNRLIIMVKIKKEIVKNSLEK